MDGRVRMAPLTWVAGAFRARVLAARLESEGIDAQLRGALESPYGLTMGDMARVDVYVPEDQLADARYVLLADEIDATLAAPSDWWDAGAEPPVVRHRRGMRWMAGALLAIAVLGTFLGAVRHW
jgi:Putative prokaryotic signal transducing protein